MQVVGNNWVSDSLDRAEGLTEAQLSDELGPRELPPGLASASKTISWWRQRQMAFQRVAQERRYKLNKEISKLNKNARKTIRESKLVPKLWSKS